MRFTEIREVDAQLVNVVLEEEANLARCSADRVLRPWRSSSFHPFGNVPHISTALFIGEDTWVRNSKLRV